MFAIDHPAIAIDLRYATADNITGHPIYARPAALLHPEAHDALMRAADLAAALDCRLIVYDAYRPPAAQWRLWETLPDATFVADPRIGSTHSRGIAVDLTLAGADGQALAMGTGFDDMREQSYHGRLDIPPDTQRNRALLLGLMTAAGWCHQPHEWWHYNLPAEDQYPIIDDKETVARVMDV
ncbi:D-alanyl-D-alanine dipeptidase [Acidihalobacter prosperus]|uniref:D-alanyl-D-alanine dipeptidase n=1 Tax=Acidihalobacter prosperus TaxID=160660 RepID=A0A1A6C102_9GAMM|nr:D-alanyl-D-alanine dipeptidase [Acidihalobacter prosperus]OBS08235.1 D-alanyl-D-alanine dipeptidase [Acidihalobacter prosperus]